MKDNFLILTNIKKTIIRLETFLDNYRRTEKVLKDNIKIEMYSLLKDCYSANIFKDSDRLMYQKKLLVHIKMLDFYIYCSHHKKLISNKQYLSISNHLLDLFVLTQWWIKSEKNKQSI